MNIFVTGASGYIGFAVAKALIASGHQVSGLTRSANGAAKLEENKIAPMLGELTNTAMLVDAANAADAVIHLAASRSGADRLAIDLVAIDAMIGALHGTNKPFILTSGTSVYRDTGDRTITEESPIDAPPHMAWRVTTESHVREAVDHGVRSVIIRPTIVYGHGGSGVIPAWITASRDLGAGFYMGNGDTWLSAVHVDDLANFYVRALGNAQAADVYNVAAESVHARDVADAISIAIGVPGQTRSLTAEEAALHFPPTAYIFPFATFLSTNSKISGEKARSQLGWTPRAPSMVEDISVGSYATK